MKLVDSTQELQSDLDQEVLLHRITSRIRQSLELQEILATTVTEVRAFLGTDRAFIYCFHDDESGKVIAESVGSDRLPSLLNLNFPADDIPPHARELFLKARQRSIVDVSTRSIGASPLNCPYSGTPLNHIGTTYRPADPCHLEYLTTMGVQFSLIVPIVHQSLQDTAQSKPRLWGLLVAHHAEPRSISDRELTVLQRVADQLMIAIAQSMLFNQAREQAQREATINRIANLLHATPTIQLKAALEEIVRVLQGSGGRLYVLPDSTGQPAELYTYGVQPTLPGQETGDGLEQHPIWQTWLNGCLNAPFQNSDDLVVLHDLYQTAAFQPLTPAFRFTRVRSLLVIGLQYRQQRLGYLTVFRDEINTEIWWAGYFKSDEQQQRPRSSFEAWREFKTGQAHKWTTAELDLVRALRHPLAMAIQQYQLYRQVQALNSNLERQVQARTAELQQSLKFDRALKQVTDQIRSTLDLKTVLQTVVREVRSLLHTDRVVIYQFTRGWQGEVIVEDVIYPWRSILGEIYDDICFPLDYASQYRHGRIQSTDNVLHSHLHPCHINFLQAIQVQANLVVPIRMGDELWGLLIAHECHAPRVWQAMEAELLQQLADQVAIAIQQAQLYEQSCTAAATATTQAEQIKHTLLELQHAQTQLIQTEKMSSLGQLVAGVAHEINNPVNFIYGNLSHVSEYTQDLLNLLSLYQRYYPRPEPEIATLADAVDLEFLMEDLPKILSSMKLGTDRIRQIVLSLRNFSRLDQSEMKPVDIHEGIDSTLLILQHRLKAKADSPTIKVVKEYAALPLVECYAGQLNQVFMNILGNAIDALEEHKTGTLQSSPNPMIRITTEVLTSDRVAIRIADNGPGMPETVRNHVFDPFFTTKPVGQGTGLGLSISYQIVAEKHSGVLKCNSQSGQGTEFWIEIPVQQTTIAA